jgi:hypothetical protein
MESELRYRSIAALIVEKSQNRLVAMPDQKRKERRRKASLFVLREEF